MTETPEDAKPTGSERRKALAAAAQERFAGSAAGDVWSRLNAVDFMNQAFVLAALLMLCGVPFIILVSTVKGANYIDNLSGHMGLNDAASSDVRTLFAASTSTLASSTVLSIVGLTVWAVSVAAVVKSVYLQVFDVDPKAAKGLWRPPVWLVVTVALTSSFTAVNHWLYDLPGGSVLAAVFDFTLNTCFWWWSMHFLLAGQRTWRYLFPSALVTGLFWAGLRFFSSLFFSSAITSNEDKYGPIGVVFILMYWLIAVGVVIIFGAVVGDVWQERRASGRQAPAFPP